MAAKVTSADSGGIHPKGRMFVEPKSLGVLVSMYAEGLSGNSSGASVSLKAKYVSSCGAIEEGD